MLTLCKHFLIWCLTSILCCTKPLFLQRTLGWISMKNDYLLPRSGKSSCLDVQSEMLGSISNYSPSRPLAHSPSMSSKIPSTSWAFLVPCSTHWLVFCWCFPCKTLRSWVSYYCPHIFHPLKSWDKHSFLVISSPSLCF